MTQVPAQVLRGLAVAAIALAWTVAAHYGSTGRGHPDLNAVVGVAPIVLAGMMLIRRLPGMPLIIGGTCAMVVGLFGLWPMLRENVALLYFLQHLGINLSLGVFFGRSLRGPGEPLITRLARFTFNGRLSPTKVRYTRQVTLAWTLFFLGNAGISVLLFAFAPPAVWSLYANVLGMPLLLLMFLGEALARRHFVPPEERPTFAMIIHAWRNRNSTEAS